VLNLSKMVAFRVAAELVLKQFALPAACARQAVVPQLLLSLFLFRTRD
jgi:hypothetical protein